MTNQIHQDAMVNHGELDLGARLKFIREHNGLSQRELAKRAGVPHSSISMIEQGQNSPSINSLAKILGGIPMSIAQFFSCDMQLLDRHILRAEDLLAQQRTFSNKFFIQSIPLKGLATTAQFERVLYAPNADTGETPHYSAKAISGFIATGNLELTINAEVSLLSSGDAFVLSHMQPYRLRNPSLDVDCIVLICIS